MPAHEELGTTLLFFRSRVRMMLLFGDDFLDFLEDAELIPRSVGLMLAHDLALAI